MDASKYVKGGRISSGGRIGRRLVLVFVTLVMLVVGATGWVLYNMTRRSLEQQMGDRLVGVALLVAEGINGDAVQGLQPGFEELELYQWLCSRLRRALERVRARRIYVFDRRGCSLLDTEPDVPIGRAYPRLRVDRVELALVWAGRAAGSVLFEGEDGVHYQWGYAPIYAGDTVVAGVGVEIGAGFLDTVRAFRRSVLIFGGISAVLTVAIGWVLARTLTGPIHRLVQAAQRIGGGNLDRPVEINSRDELGYLGETMEEMRKRILARDEQLRQMLGGVAHEIRNPLGGIEIYAGLIAEDLPDRDPRKAHILKVIGEVRTLNRVISEFLEFARPVPAAPERVEVANLVQEASFLLAPEMAANKVTYQEDLPAGIGVFTDRGQVKRALVNLMKNAVQAMPGGGTLRVSAGRREGQVVLSVMDTGTGISGQHMERLFEPFFTTREQGSGLGLAMVKQIAEQNGGQVRVESQEGRGTTFWLGLPEDLLHRRHV